MPTLRYVALAVVAVLAGIVIPFAWLALIPLACLWLLHCMANMR